MLDGKRVLVVVPARGGSKGIPLKNLANVCGETLIAHVGKVIKQLDFVDAAIVSTDNTAIASEALRAGIGFPFLRPPSLSGDLISDIQVLRHALNTIEPIDACLYDIIVMLQPTCPMRRVWHVEHTVNRLLKGFDSVWTVTKIDKKFHPHKQMSIDEYGRLDYHAAMGKLIVARQQLDDRYIRNGACYAFTRECLLVQETILGKASSAIITEPLVNIDTPEDLAEAERLMAGRA